MSFEEVAEGIGKGVDAAGIVVIVGGAALATVAFVVRLVGDELGEAYRLYRRALGRAILLGLEFLVAADIIRTVAIEPTFGSVGVLAIIVAIRTFLSFTLELEIDGRWPWQPRTAESSGAHQPLRRPASTS
ncbi:MAG: DUF1622 domain-containing protein [Actinomycetota bacterium]|nr:DUF1622 domain-containing protein [Actinomycetota bacterium]